MPALSFSASAVIVTGGFDLHLGVGEGRRRDQHGGGQAGDRGGQDGSEPWTHG
jgi:hypothetical protein